MGLQMRQLLATLCVTSSLTLVALSGSDLTGGYPTAVMGPILDTVVISCDVEGASYKESDDA
jgi:hypothetical protein